MAAAVCGRLLGQGVCKILNNIEFRNIDKAYGSQVVLEDFSAVFPAGQTLALMGRSGGGKTTISRLLMGLEKPDAGEILGTQGLRFSCVFQENRLLPGFSALDNVALVLPREKWDRVQPALSALGLTEEDWHKPSRELSGGQKRRVALARAMEADSDFVILDEAFKGLDEESREQAFLYCKNNRKDRGLLVITHDMEEAEALGAKILFLSSIDKLT